MITRKEGSINNLIYDKTIYNNNTSKIYLTINQFEFLIKDLLCINETTLYIKFNPFYVNSKLNCQIEFDDYMFYMECREDFTSDDMKEHWTNCMDHIYDIPHEIEQYDEMDNDKKRMARILYPICKVGDYKSFHNYLDNYREYLNELLPILFNEAIDKLELSVDDMAFGYFCFEVNSG